MPIEIRELVIKARVEPDGPRTAVPSLPPPSEARPQEEEVVRLSLQEMLRVLEDQRER